jgi:hypothetical protein
MGDSLADIVRNLRSARDQLLSESQQAAGQGNWARAKTFMELAERTDQLHQAILAQKFDRAQESENALEPLHAPENGEEEAAQPLASRNRYPRYLVREDVLVKQGLKRDGHDVYEHAVPHERYDDIIERLGSMASSVPQGRQRTFSIEQVQQELDCPRYMTYVVVSLLLREKHLISSRKGCYTFAAATSIRNAAAELWERLKGATIV